MTQYADIIDWAPLRRTRLRRSMGVSIMSFRQKLVEEIKELTVAGLYFITWLGVLLLLKKLTLDQYEIEFHGLSVALVGALVLAKVVLILEHVPLGKWTRNRPAWLDVILRTILYTAGVFVVLLLEKGFEGRHEYGGMGSSISALLKGADLDHVVVNTIVLSGALLVYNAFSVIRQNLGPGGLLQMFLSPLPDESDVGRAGHPAS